MAFDTHKNFAYSTVATAPSPATSGTSLVVQSGDGAKFPATPFNAIVYPAGAQPLTTNSEIVRVTNISTDTFTITRGATSGGGLNGEPNNQNRSIIIGDQIDAGVTARSVTDIEGNFPAGPIAAWTSWTPTPTNFTVGNGTLTCAYFQVGKQVTCQFQFLLGTTSAISGTFIFSKPVTGISYANLMVLGDCYMLVAGVNNIMGYFFDSTTTTIRVLAGLANGTYTSVGVLNATTPATWASGDMLTGTFTYQAA